MARSPFAFARLWLGTLAAAGVVVSHEIAYWINAPGAHARAELLQATGHRYWTLVVAAALALLVFGLSAFVGRLLFGDGELPRQGPLLVAIVPRLAVIQCAGFLALEIGERYLSGGSGARSLSSVVGEPVVAMGLAVQFIVALAGALLMLCIGHGVVRLGRLLRRRSSWGRPLSSRRRPLGASPRTRADLTVAGPRGPPRGHLPAIA
jgi:hypothetical protein